MKAVLWVLMVLNLVSFIWNGLLFLEMGKWYSLLTVVLNLFAMFIVYKTYKEIYHG
jgi:sterol desaturase/sphingolipid hydroxylase (fatty acid hydroxylase superfamily)